MPGTRSRRSLPAAASSSSTGALRPSWKPRAMISATVSGPRRGARAGEPRARYRAERAPADAGPLLVAASIGPYGAWLADGAEYRGRYGLDRPALRDFHRERLR